jgi:cupin fold WbuC family metalloprotein
MSDSGIPQLSEWEIEEGLSQARSSPRHRYPKLLHQPGAEFNRVFNFITRDSYMQPHLHPGEEKIEEIYIVEGRVATIFFDDQGTVRDVLLLEKGGVECARVPAFTWHTYVMLTDSAITYETMMGVYEPTTWKRFAPWAPKEDTIDSDAYLMSLRDSVQKRLLAT